MPRSRFKVWKDRPARGASYTADRSNILEVNFRTSIDLQWEDTDEMQGVRLVLVQEKKS